MAAFECKYKELGFFHEEKPFKFSGGKFETEDAGLIGTLEKLKDVVRVDQPVKTEAPKQEAKEEVKAEKPKAPKKPKAAAAK
jgi:hypothetical protein